TTEDQGSPSDEPYVVFFTVNLAQPAEGKLDHTVVFEGVDETRGHRDRAQHLRLWGRDHFAPIDLHVDDVIVLVALMESDDSDQADVLAAASRAMKAHAAEIASSHDTRENKISRL